ncbi:MAG: lysophospholipid acyltransferase family protein [Guyparkeria sp.]|uniref:lysophospholipid acyltransferase family protein n=1 Tax=Guyparkeria sp. TaxID=2035736 RepID=UPI00397B58C0
MRRKTVSVGPSAFRPGLLAPRYWPTWFGLGLLYLLALGGHPLRRGVARLAAGLYRRVNPRRAGIIATNLRLCFPHQSAETREEWLRRYLERHMLALLDLGRIRRARSGELTRQTEVEGQAVLERLRAEPGLILTVHSVGLEWAAAMLAETVPGSTIYKPFAANPVVDWWFGGMRTRHGTEALPRERGMGPHLKALRSGRSFFYIADEDLGAEHSVFAPFFGVEKATLPLAGKLARASGRPVYPVIGQLDEVTGRYRLHFLDPVELPATADREAAAAINRVIEELVIDDPAQLMWSLKYFKTTPPGEADRYRD